MYAFLLHQCLVLGSKKNTARPKAPALPENYQPRGSGASATTRTPGAVSPTPTFRWSVPAGVLRAAGRLNGRLSEIVDRLIGSAGYSLARIERELGWRAQVGLAEGVRDMLR